MSQSLVEALRGRVDGTVTAGERLAGYTTLKVGGVAAALVRAESTADLVTVADVCHTHAVPWLIIGRGSNLLVPDAGWPGVAVVLGRAFRGVDIESDSGVVVAGAAEPMPILANTVARNGLGGLAFGVAIPGTLGGAVRMNAGAHGAELRDVLVSADVVRLAAGGAAETIAADDLGMRYRSTDLPADAVVVRATLRLQPTEAPTLEAAMAEMRQWRRDHQPINEPSCGSVFRNPPGDSAGRLIEAAGMKGHTVGRAAVSEVHANFITVSPGARAADVHAVIADVRAAVARSCGVDLETEVVLVGFADHSAATGGDRR